MSNDVINALVSRYERAVGDRTYLQTCLVDMEEALDEALCDLADKADELSARAEQIAAASQKIEQLHAEVRRLELQLISNTDSLTYKTVKIESLQAEISRLQAAAQAVRGSDVMLDAFDRPISRAEILAMVAEILKGSTVVNRLTAVKLVRRLTGAGLKETKDFVCDQLLTSRKPVMVMPETPAEPTFKVSDLPHGLRHPLLNE